MDSVALFIPECLRLLGHEGARAVRNLWSIGERPFPRHSPVAEDAAEHGFPSGGGVVGCTLCPHPPTLTDCIGLQAGLE